VGVVDAINSWNNDVTTVNNFLDLAASSNNEPSTIAAHISNVMDKATDEPNQLQVLACESDLQAAPPRMPWMICSATFRASS